MSDNGSPDTGIDASIDRVEYPSSSTQDEIPEVIEIIGDGKSQEAKQQVEVLEKEASEIRLIEITDSDILEDEKEGATAKADDKEEATAKADEEAKNDCKKVDPIEETLMLFLQDPLRRELTLPSYMSVHERFLVHRFVQEHNLKWESTGNNKIVVSKEESGSVKEAAGSVKKAAGSQQLAKKNTIIYKAHEDVIVQMFNRTKVNQDVTPQALMLDEFIGVYALGKNANLVLHSMCDTMKVPMRVDRQDGDKIFTISIYINEIYVAQGRGRSVKDAKEEAGSNALNFLKSKGLRVLSPLRNLPKKYSINKDMHFFGLKSEQQFRQNVNGFVKKFLADPDVLQFRVYGTKKKFAGQATSRATIIKDIAKKFRLITHTTPDSISVYKVNSTIHNLHVEPAIAMESERKSMTVPEPDPAAKAVPESAPETVPVLESVLALESVPESQEDMADENGEKGEEKEDNSDDQVTPHELSREQIVKKPNYEANINRGLTLRFLKMESVCGVYHPPSNFLNYLLQITKACNVPCEFKLSGPFKGPHSIRWRVVLRINNIYVAQSSRRTSEDAQVVCAKDAFHYLVSKGLRIVYSSKVKDDQIKQVSREELNEKGIQQVFTEFLNEKQFLEMRFCADINKIEKELIEVLIEKNSLTPGYEGTGEMIAWKKDSSLHAMAIASTTEGGNAISESKAIALKITKEDLVKNSSIREHVENFVKSTDLLELQFTNDIDGIQKELVKLVAEKHKLKHDVDSSSGQIVLCKNPATKSEQQNEISKAKRKHETKSKWGISYSKPDYKAQNLGKRSVLRGEPKITKTIRLDSDYDRRQHDVHRDDRSRQGYAYRKDNAYRQDNAYHGDNAYRGGYMSESYRDDISKGVPLLTVRVPVHQSASQALLHDRSKAPTKLGSMWGMGQPTPLMGQPNPLMRQPTTLMGQPNPLMVQPTTLMGQPNPLMVQPTQLMEDAMNPLRGQQGTSSWNFQSDHQRAGYDRSQSPPNAWHSRDRPPPSSSLHRPPPSSSLHRPPPSPLHRLPPSPSRDRPPPSANSPPNLWHALGRSRGSQQSGKTSRGGGFSRNMVLQEDMM